VKKYPELFRYLYKENGGHGSVINCGIKEASGRYFRILDGDDWVITENLLALLNQLKTMTADVVADRKRNVDMQTGNGVADELPGQVIDTRVYEMTEITREPDVAKYFMIHNFSVLTEGLLKNQVSVLEGVFYEDSEYVVKATAWARTVCFLDLEIYQYMVGNVNQSVSTANFVKRYAHFDRVTKEMLAYAKEQGDSYSAFRARTTVLTQFYIAFLYDTDRSQGLERGKTLGKYIKTNYPDMWKQVKKRYFLNRVFHAVGMDYEGLQRLKKRL
jgi:glycosyltransferase involved in cell wall biosynthesis